MARGDHIKVYRRFRLYAHHGIDMGDGTVIHFAGEPLRVRRARVVRTDMATFLRGGARRVVRHASGALPESEVVSRAESLLASGAYSVFWNNCEHFAMYCKTGRGRSRQVRRVAWVGSAVLAGAVTWTGRRLLRRITGGKAA